jgi:uroporphyrinogen-III synthase
MRVLVTRTEPAATRLAAAMRARGHDSVAWPALAITPVVPPSAHVAAARRAGVAIFVSVHAVRCGLHLLAALPSRQCLAVGAATAAALREAGVAAVAPAAGEGAEALLRRPALVAVAGADVAIVRGEGGLDVLERELALRGARVHVLEVYRRAPAAASALASQPAFDAVCVGSGDGLRVVVAALAAGHLRVNAGALLVVPSARVAAAARADPACAALRVVDAGAAGDAAVIAALAASGVAA